MKKIYQKPETIIQTEEWKVCKDTRRKSNNKKTCFKNKIIGHLYEVSNRGRVRIDGVIKQIKLNPKTDPSFCGERIYRLVAKLFIQNPLNKPYIDHIDTNRFNNNVNNLRWCTQRENMNNPLTRKKCRKAQLKYYKEHPERKEEISKQHKISYWSEETRKNMSIRFSGENGTNFGKKLMNNGITQKFILIKDIQEYQKEGWVLGKLGTSPIKDKHRVYNEDGSYCYEK